MVDGRVCCGGIGESPMLVDTRLSRTQGRLCFRCAGNKLGSALSHAVARPSLRDGAANGWAKVLVLGLAWPVFVNRCQVLRMLTSLQ